MATRGNPYLHARTPSGLLLQRRRAIQPRGMVTIDWPGEVYLATVAGRAIDIPATQIGSATTYGQDQQGKGVIAPTYNSQSYIQQETIDGASFNPSGGMTVVCVGASDFPSSGTAPGLIGLLRLGEFYGIISLAFEHIGSNKYSFFRAGDSTSAGFSRLGETGGINDQALFDSDNFIFVCTFRDDGEVTFASRLIGGSSDGQVLYHVQTGRSYTWANGSYETLTGTFKRSGNRSHIGLIHMSAVLEGAVGKDHALRILNNPYGELLRSSWDTPFYAPSEEAPPVTPELNPLFFGTNF